MVYILSIEILSPSLDRKVDCLDQQLSLVIFRKSTSHFGIGCAKNASCGVASRSCELRCELRTASCELHVASCSRELRVAFASCELRVAVASCELRVASCKFRVASFELRVASFELQLQLGVVSQGNIIS